MSEKIPLNPEAEILLDTQIIGEALNELTQPDKVAETASLLALREHITNSGVSKTLAEKINDLIDASLQDRASTEASRLQTILADMIGTTMPDYE